MSKRRSTKSQPEAVATAPAAAAIPRSRRWEFWLSAAISCGLSAILFREVLFLPRFFCYRDTDVFFAPLFRFVHEQWSEGRIPLWNPYGSGGSPLLAQGTPAVLYPLQLIFRLPLRFEVNLNLYILLHFVLALAFTYLLARRLRTGPAAAALAAISYAFGGAILFQFSNLPFLGSATWMPAAWYATIEMLQRRSLRWALVLAATAALMVICGEPQGAYHALLLAALAALVRWQVQRRRLKLPWNEQLTWDLLRSWAAERWRQKAALLLTVAGSMSLLLSAPQLLPTAELARLSTRSNQRLPHSIYQIPGFFWSREPLPPRADSGEPAHWYDTMAGIVVPGERNHFIRYLYSLSPVRLIEFVWPNVTGGRIEKARWLIAVGGEPKDALWFPSCYLGLAPLVLAAVIWNPCCRRPWDAWLSWIVVLGTLGSFGSYGLIGLFRVAVTGRLQHWPDSVGSEVGGLYWLVTTCLPAYDGFRYPVKLLAPAVLALALLAAIGCRRVMRDRRTQTRALCLLLLIATASLVACAILVCFPSLFTGTNTFDWAAARMALIGSFGQTLAIAAAVGTALALVRGGAAGGRWRGVARYVPLVLVAVTAVDLAVGNAGIVVTSPLSIRARKPALASAIAEDRRSRPSDGSPFPRVLLTLAMDGDEWELGRSYFAAQQHVGLFIPNSETLCLEQFEPYLNPWPENGLGYIMPRCGLDAWGVQYFGWAKKADKDNPHSTALGLTHAWREPRYSPPPNLQLLPQGPPLPNLPQTEGVAALAKVTIVANPTALPRIRVVREIEFTPPHNALNRAQAGLLMVSVNYPLPGFRDLRTMAIVEDEELWRQHGPGIVRLGDSSADSADRSRFLQYAADMVKIESELAAQGLLVISETHYPGWELAVSTNGGPVAPQPILRTNGGMRGVMLPAGKHELTFRYRPASFWHGVAIGACAWLLLIAIGMRDLVGRWRTRGG